MGCSKLGVSQLGIQKLSCLVSAFARKLLFHCWYSQTCILRIAARTPTAMDTRGLRATVKSRSSPPGGGKEKGRGGGGRPNQFLTSLKPVWALGRAPDLCGTTRGGNIETDIGCQGLRASARP